MTTDTIVPLDAGIMMRSGAYFNYNKPAEFEGPIEDIAHALGNVCRYAGHCAYFFSVAQHAVNASYAVDPEFAFDALMHDTAEAVTGDITTPLKKAVPFFKQLETQIEAGMAVRFGFNYPLPDLVKLVDLEMLMLERMYLFDTQDDWEVLKGITVDHLVPLVDLNDQIVMSPMSPKVAAARFVARFYELCPVKETVAA